MALSLEVEARQVSGTASERLELEENSLTVRELIESRVRQRLGPKPAAEIRRATADALEAFERKTYLVVLDDRWLERLEERVTLTPVSRLTFWRLVPLAGG
jgi:preprotein translocase subunit SecA